MIHDLKMSFKLIKFGFQAKMQIVFMLIFFFVGLAMEVLGDGTYWLGAWFVLLSPMYFAQLLYGLLMSNMVMASPYNRRLQTAMSAVVMFVFSMLCMTLLVVIKLWKLLVHPEFKDAILTTLLASGVAVFVISTYTAVVYKKFAIAFIILMLTVGGVSGWSGYITGMGEHIVLPILHQMSFGAVVAASYGCVLLGILMQYGMSCLLYRKPLSEYAQGAMMRKYLKG